MTMAAFVYLLGTLVCLVCALLLLRAYSTVNQRLLLWSGLCFVGLTTSNLLLFLDLVVLPHLNLYVWRLGTAAAGMLLLLYGLVFESD